MFEPDYKYMLLIVAFVVVFFFMFVGPIMKAAL